MPKYNLNNIYEWPMTTRYLVVGLICAIVFYLGYGWDISALKTQIANAQAKEDELKSQLTFVINKQIKIEREAAQLPKMQASLVEWQKKLINYADLPELLNQILKLGGNNQLHFSQFNPGAEKKVDIYLKVPIKVIVVGGYHQLASFVSQVANMPWIVVVGDFTLSKENKNDVLGSKLAEQATAENLLTAEITLEVYHLIDARVLNAK
jgi:type IV pilus assembly protein PilO